jgi:hypothetical protein
MNYTPIFNTSDFLGGFYWLKEIIDKQNSNNNEKWKNPAPNFWKLWTRNMISIFIGLTSFHYLYLLASKLKGARRTYFSWRATTLQLKYYPAHWSKLAYYIYVCSYHFLLRLSYISTNLKCWSLLMKILTGRLSRWNGVVSNLWNSFQEHRFQVGFHLYE